MAEPRTPAARRARFSRRRAERTFGFAHGTPTESRRSPRLHKCGCRTRPLRPGPASTRRTVRRYGLANLAPALRAGWRLSEGSRDAWAGAAAIQSRRQPAVPPECGRQNAGVDRHLARSRQALPADRAATLRLAEERTAARHPSGLAHHR